MTNKEVLNSAFKGLPVLTENQRHYNVMLEEARKELKRHRFIAVFIYIVAAAVAIYLIGSSSIHVVTMRIMICFALIKFSLFTVIIVYSTTMSSQKEKDYNINTQTLTILAGTAAFISFATAIITCVFVTESFYWLVPLSIAYFFYRIVIASKNRAHNSQMKKIALKYAVAIKHFQTTQN